MARGGRGADGLVRWPESALDAYPPWGHLGIMALGPVRKIWLALLLLVATLSSAPLGSMEQADVHGWQTDASASSVPASLPGRGLRPDGSRATPDRPPPLDASHPFSPSLPSGAGAEAAPGGIARARLGRAGDGWTPPVCERLPYDPNAPPSAPVRLPTA